jgi:hypothetical protein
MDGKMTKEIYYDKTAGDRPPIQQTIVMDSMAVEHQTHEGVVVDMFGFKVEVFSWEGVAMFGTMVSIALIGMLVYRRMTGQWVPLQGRLANAAKAFVGKKVS